MSRDKDKIKSKHKATSKMTFFYLFNFDIYFETIKYILLIE